MKLLDMRNHLITRGFSQQKLQQMAIPHTICMVRYHSSHSTNHVAKGSFLLLKEKETNISEVMEKFEEKTKKN